MPVTEDGYRTDSWQVIYDRLEQVFEDQFDSTIEIGDTIGKQLEAEAKTLARNQEQTIQRVYQAAYLADAEGKELDKLVQLIGLTRRDAVASTGIIEFDSGNPPLATYTIPENTTVQTRGTNPIRFNTTQQTALRYIDGFEENLDSWDGDNTDFSRNTTSPITGSASLEVPATDGVRIESVEKGFTIGTTFGFQLNPASGSITAFQFGIQDTSNYHELVFDTSANDLRLRTYVGGAIDNERTKSVTIPTEASYIELEWSLHNDLRATIYDTKARDTVIDDIALSYTPEWIDGPFAIKSLDANATALVDEISTPTVYANIQAEYGGVRSNVGADTIRVAPDGITGVENITNPVGTGDRSLKNTELSPLVIGLDREEDPELRERAFQNTDIGGAASVSALGAQLNEIEGVNSVTIKRNREATAVDGLPSHSYEPIIYGGEYDSIAQVLHDTASIDSHDVGGVHGNEVTHSVESETTGQNETYHWSEPIEATLDITLDLVTGENYIGDEDIQSMVVNYIGGTDNDGSQVPGLDNGEDVYEAVLKGKLVDPANHGVWEVDSITIDDNSDGTDDTTTTSSGADVYAVSDDTVAITNARDGSITVNTTPR